MFLALDDSKDSHQKVLGCLVIPTDKVPKFESDWTDLRIKERVFGELKWICVSKSYLNKYKKFIDIFFNNEYITFHSICYRGDKYRAAYILIRTVIYKILNEKFNSKIFILFDNEGRIGETSTRKIKELLNVDKKFNIPIEFCCQGSSHVLGVLQLADILSGAVCSKINRTARKDSPKFLLRDFIENKNIYPLDWSGNKLPNLYEFKMHFFDPNDNPRNK